jgi:hypothetical protein
MIEVQRPPKIVGFETGQYLRNCKVDGYFNAAQNRLISLKREYNPSFQSGR